MEQVLAIGEWYLAFLQGKGSGAGWDMPAEIAGAARFVDRTDPVIFDVGANVGQWSHRIVEAMGPGLRLFQFEPSAYCCEMLRSSDFPNRTLIAAAVSEYKGRATMWTPAEGSQNASLYPRRDSFIPPAEQQEQVETVRIDDIVDEYGLDRVDYMKMDIEGAELAALRGAEHSLRTHTIRALSFEFGSANINSCTFLHDFWDLFQEMRYRLYRICPGGVLIPVRNYHEGLEYFRLATNYIASAVDDEE